MDSVAAEKETAARRYRRLQRLGTLFRCIEALGAAILLSWLFSHLPTAVRLSGEFLRQLAALLISPRFVFFLGNAIVLHLLVKYGQLSSSSSSPSDSTPSSAGDAGENSAVSADDLYQQFLESRGQLSYSLPPSEPAAPEEEVVFEDKAVCVETPTRKCRRSRSERMERQPTKEQPELRRTETDVGRKTEKVAAAETEEVEEHDAEQFRRMIEAFIAKQTKFHREESMAIVSAEGARALVCSAGSP